MASEFLIYWSYFTKDKTEGWNTEAARLRPVPGYELGLIYCLFWQLQAAVSMKLPQSSPLQTGTTMNALSWLQQGTRTTPHSSDVPDGSVQAMVRQVFAFALKVALSGQHRQNQSCSNVKLQAHHVPAHQLRGQESQRRGSKKRSRRKL